MLQPESNLSFDSEFDYHNFPDLNYSGRDLSQVNLPSLIQNPSSEFSPDILTFDKNFDNINSLSNNFHNHQDSAGLFSELESVTETVNLPTISSLKQIQPIKQVGMCEGLFQKHSKG